MGILNVTPDSFSDGGRFFEPDAALRQAERMITDGADILDIGAESSRPGADPVDAEEEWRRIRPVLEAVVEKTDVPVSLDTYKAEVARRALDDGAYIINDISGLRLDPGIADVVAATGAGLVLMHMRGTPRNMQADTHYEDLLGEIESFLLGAAAKAESAGVAHEQIVIDPGIGFGKSPQQNLTLLKNIPRFRSTGYPVLFGASRKSFLKPITGREVNERLAGSLAAAAWCIASGADILRVHDVRETVDVLNVMEAIGGA
jgi:dihydropteroate synthase